MSCTSLIYILHKICLVYVDVSHLNYYVFVFL